MLANVIFIIKQECFVQKNNLAMKKKNNNTIQSIKILISFIIMLIMMKSYLITIIQCVNKCILWNFYLPFKINTKCM